MRAYAPAGIFRSGMRSKSSKLPSTFSIASSQIFLTLPRLRLPLVQGSPALPRLLCLWFDRLRD